MRPEIPKPLADRVESIAEQEGYSTGSELVRDGVRRLLDQLEGRVSEGEIRNWLKRERNFEVLTSETFPRVKYDIDSSETTTIEEADLTMIVKTRNVPLYIHRGWKGEPLKVNTTVPKRRLKKNGHSVLLEAPGYLVGVDDNRQIVPDFDTAKGIRLEKQLHQHSLSRHELINTIHGIVGCLHFAFDGQPTFNELFNLWRD